MRSPLPSRMVVLPSPLSHSRRDHIAARLERSRLAIKALLEDRSTDPLVAHVLPYSTGCPEIFEQEKEERT